MIMIFHGHRTHAYEFGRQVELVSAYLSRPANIILRPTLQKAL